jgi:hypothetical protein
MSSFPSIPPPCRSVLHFRLFVRMDAEPTVGRMLYRILDPVSCACSKVRAPVSWVRTRITSTYGEDGDREKPPRQGFPSRPLQIKTLTREVLRLHCMRVSSARRARGSPAFRHGQAPNEGHAQSRRRGTIITLVPHCMQDVEFRPANPSAAKPLEPGYFRSSGFKWQ